MAKKRKKDNAHRVPPLSGVDTAIYLGGIAMICGVGVGYIALVSWLSKYAALRDSAVIAYIRMPSSLLFLPFLAFLALGCLLPLLFFFKKRKPILGSKRIHYGEAPWKAEWYPLFGPQRKRHPLPEKGRRHARKHLRIWLICLLMALLLASLSLFGRQELRADHSIVRYNVLNQQTDTIRIPEDCTGITVFAEEKHSLRRGWELNPYWEYGLVLHLKTGEELRIDNGELATRGGNHASKIAVMLEYKKKFSLQNTTVEGTEQLGNVIAYCNLDTQEAALLRELFQG